MRRNGGMAFSVLAETVLYFQQGGTPWHFAIVLAISLQILALRGFMTLLAKLIGKIVYIFEG